MTAAHNAAAANDAAAVHDSDDRRNEQCRMMTREAQTMQLHRLGYGMFFFYSLNCLLHLTNVFIGY